MILIFLPYQRCEGALAAFGLYRALQQAGREVKLMHYGNRVRRLHPAYDHLIEQASITAIRNHLPGLKHTIWFGLVGPERLRELSSVGVRNHVYLSGFDIDDEDLPILAEYDTLFLSTDFGAGCFRQHFREKVVSLPFLSGVPMWRRNQSENSRAVLFPLWGDQINRSEKSLLQSAMEILDCHAEATLTFMFGSHSSVPTKLRRSLKRVTRSARGRFRHIYCEDWPSAAAEYRTHPIVVCGEVWAQFLVGCSMAARHGSVVVGWDNPLVADIVDQSNAVLLPCDRDQDPLGMVRVLPRYSSLAPAVAELLCDSRRLRRLQERPAELSEMAEQRARRRLAEIL
jgi:hypothetical protein